MDVDYKELVEYLDGKFQTIETRLEELGTNFHQLQESVDMYAKRADGYFSGNGHAFA